MVTLNYERMYGAGNNTIIDSKGEKNKQYKFKDYVVFETSNKNGSCARN